MSVHLAIAAASNGGSDAQAPAAIVRVSEFDGVRALLALWVLTYHVVVITGHVVPLLLAGSHAVSAFFALSGFVIANLLMRDHESYGAFIVRRFFRLFPTFAICVCASAVLVALGLMPRNFESRDLALHLALHSSMLHGAFPTNWVPGAATAILNPAWSISVEWQFYLVAPLFFGLRRKHPQAAWLLWLAFAAVAPRVATQYLHVGAASLFNQTQFFTLGIVSYFVYAWAVENPLALDRPGILVPLIPTILLLPSIPIAANVGVIVWLVVLGVVLADRASDASSPVVWCAKRLQARPLAKLGSLAYSLYLVHEPLVWLSTHAVRAVLHIEGLALTAMVAALAIPSSIALASVLHAKIELPCIELGKRVTKYGRRRDQSARTGLELAATGDPSSGSKSVVR